MSGQTLTDACREQLPRFRGHTLVPTSTVPRRVREALIASGMITADHYASGYLQSTMRAEGVCADPRTFEA